MGMLKEFKTFALKGNVLDMAIGIVIGLAFGKIISSAVADLIMPVLGLLVGGMDFANLQIVLKEATEEVEAVTIGYGAFIQTIVDFIIIAFCLFLFIKGFNSLKKKEEAKPVEPPKLSNEEVLLTEIRDLLKNK